MGLEFFPGLGGLENPAIGTRKEIFDWLKQVRCPILFIKGAESSYVSNQEVGIPQGTDHKGRTGGGGKCRSCRFPGQFLGLFGCSPPLFETKGENG